MPNTMLSEKPVLLELATILGRADLLEETGSPDFKSCLGIAASTGKPCLNRTTEAKQQVAKKLYDEFNLMKECISTDELRGQIKLFIDSSHCHHHKKTPINQLEAWPKTRWEKNLQLVNSTTTIESTDSNQPSASLSITATTITTEFKADEQTPLEDTPQRKEATYVQVEAVTEVLSTMTVTDNEVKATEIVREGLAAVTITENEIKPTETINTDVEFSSKHIDGFGIVSLQRKGSMRNPSPIIEKIYQPLTDRQQQKGIVYILEHKSEKNMFKIGYTQYNSKTRRSMGMKCNAENSNTIYETPDGRFFAAEKAEKLAQVLLRQHNLKVEDCEICGGGHKEWFRASEKDVREAVELMEKFVKLPAYALCPKDNKWKLSDIGHETLKSMCDPSPQRFAAVMNQTREKVIYENLDKPALRVSQRQRGTPVGIVEPDPSESEQPFAEDVKSQDPTITIESIEPDSKKKGSRKSSGASFGRGLRKMVDGVGKVRKGMDEYLARSREGTPELDSGNSMRSRGQDDGRTMQDTIQDSFWGFDPSQFSDLGKRVKNGVDAFVTDFHDEFNRDSKGTQTAKVE